jgi:hypothetical protein
MKSAQRHFLFQPRAVRAGGISALVLLAALLPAGPAWGASGPWERAWGMNVGGLGVGPDICTTAANCVDGYPGGRGGGFVLPDGASTDAAGNVYVADSRNNRIQKFDSSGNFLAAWGKDVVAGGATGYEVCIAAASCQAGQAGGRGGELDWPTAIATDAAGNVYVADTGNQRIQKFDSSGNFLLAWGRDVNIFGGTGFETCNGGNGSAICKAGQVGGLGGELHSPRGVATDAAGYVYVSDTHNDRIQRFDSSGNFQRAWGKDVVSGNAETGFEICTMAASCKQGAGGGLGGELSGPEGVAADAVGDVYVVDGGNIRIQKFDSSGNWSRTWGGGVVDGAPFLEICTSGPKCQRGTTGGLGGEFFFPGINGPGPLEVEVFSPGGVATDAAGNVYVADSGNNRIQKFDSSGHFLVTWGKDVVSANGGTGFEICTVAASCQTGVEGVLGGEMRRPQGVATNSVGDLYVVEFLSNRVQKFSDSAPPPPHPTTSALSCTPSSVELGAGSAICTVTVTDVGAPPAPGGSVALQSDGAGAYDGDGTCTLAALTATQASCQVEYIPSAVGSGNHQITATYAGDRAHDGSQATTSIGVTAPPTSTTGTGSQTGTGTGTGTQGTNGTTANARCQLLAKKLKKAKTKAAKRKVRRKLRALGC